MKRTNIFSFTLVIAALLVAGAVRLHAQGGIAPSGQFGLHIDVSGSTVAGAQYAFSPSLQAGAGLGYVNTGGNSATTLELYVRFLLEGTVNPILQAGFTNGSTSASSTSASGLYGAAGLQYFINRNVGVYGLVHVIDLPLQSGSDPSFGIFDPRMGLEWYFNK
ncbi:MAG TPA: hypothetical protein VHI13_20455 [Candidatus Kapabacteria bacterium]|nr:hypothetical protein [Candidatus Kapabacteria bacterium]